MLILGLLGMYFDAVVVFVTKSSLLFRLAVARLCSVIGKTGKSTVLLRSSSCSDGFEVVCWSCQFKIQVGPPDLSLDYFLFKYVETLGDFV